MTSDRPYRAARSETSALTTIWRDSAKRYDPAVVSALLALAREGRLPSRETEAPEAIPAAERGERRPRPLGRVWRNVARRRGRDGRCWARTQGGRVAGGYGGRLRTQHRAVQRGPGGELRFASPSY